MTQLSTILPSLTRQKTKCLPCRDALYHPHQLRHAIHRHTLHQKMHMISIRANLQKFHLVALFNLYARLLQHLVNFAISVAASSASRLCARNLASCGLRQATRRSPG